MWVAAAPCTPPRGWAWPALRTTSCGLVTSSEGSHGTMARTMRLLGTTGPVSILSQHRWWRVGSRARGGHSTNTSARARAMRGRVVVRSMGMGNNNDDDELDAKLKDKPQQEETLVSNRVEIQTGRRGGTGLRAGGTVVYAGGGVCCRQGPRQIHCEPFRTAGRGRPWVAHRRRAGVHRVNGLL